MNDQRHPPLLGYTDRFSARPGESVQVKVSSYLEGEFQAHLVRIICADPNPEGTGIVERGVDGGFVGSFPARAQPFIPGSCMKADLPSGVQLPEAFSVSAMIWPTRLEAGDQSVLSITSENGDAALTLGLDDSARPRLTLRMADGTWNDVVLTAALTERQWVRLWASS